MQIVVLTSDITSWSLRPFAQQWAKYGIWDFPITVLGYTPPEQLDWARFVSIGPFSDFPVHRWSDGIIQGLTHLVHDELVLVMMDDYWLIREVDREAIRLAVRYMLGQPDVIRFDLTTDRLYSGAILDLDAFGRLDIIQASKTADYNLSFQAAIWRRSQLLEMLRPGETPWESELYGTQRINQSPYRVLGTRQWPMKYLIAINKGQFERDGSWCFPPRQLRNNDLKELQTAGWIPQENAQ